MRVYSLRPDVQLNYWEVLWRSMMQLGWKLDHSAFTDNGSGGIRHLIRATRSDEEVTCSAPTMSQAVELVYRETRGPAAIPRLRPVN